MEITKIVSEWKKRPRATTGRNKPIKRGYKRVEAIIKTKFGLETKHLDIKQ